MFEPLAAYLMAFGAMAFAGASALTLFYVVRHLDPPEAAPTPEQPREPVAA